MPEQFANDAYTTLAEDIDSSQTDVEPDDTTLFPDPADGEFRIRIGDEFMLVTGINAGVWTVERAVEGMGITPTGTATSHEAGTQIRQVLTRDAIASLGGGGGSGILIPELVLPEDDDFQESVMDSKWTRVRHTTTDKGDWTVGGGVLSWQQRNASAGNEMDVWVQADSISVGDYVQAGFRFLPNATWYSHAIGFSDSGTWNSGTQVMSWTHWTGGTYRHMMNTYVGFQNRTQDGAVILDHGVSGTPFHIRVKYESANTWGFSVSPNGRNWYTAQTNYSRTMTPTHIFVGTGLLNPGAALLNILDLYYFRKNAGTP